MKSRRPGRPRIPAQLQQLIADMAAANRTWGEERIAAELRLKLGVTVSPRTVRRYMPRRPPVGPRTQSSATFLRNHAGAVLACDFFVVVTATFQRVYVFVILDIATRQIVHWNLTRHPTAEWTIQQFRNGLCFPVEGPSRSGSAVKTAGTSSPRSITRAVLGPEEPAFCQGKWFWSPDSKFVGLVTLNKRLGQFCECRHGER